jgi:hypothetical protein
MESLLGPTGNPGGMLRAASSKQLLIRPGRAAIRQLFLPRAFLCVSACAVGGEVVYFVIKSNSFVRLPLRSLLSSLSFSLFAKIWRAPTCLFWISLAHFLGRGKIDTSAAYIWWRGAGFTQSRFLASCHLPKRPTTHFHGAPP